MIITTTLIISYISPSYSARYTFSGKERDEETGFSYFGARYYNSDYSIWLSVDPLSDKTPFVSPYAYCINNPIKIIDPNGEEGIVVSGSPGNHSNKRHFLENGLDRALKSKSHFQRKGESTTWLIYNDKEKGYSSDLINEYSNKAKEKGISVKVISDVDEIINYVNNKNGDGSRERDKITSFYYVGHSTPGDLCVGYGGSEQNFDPSDFKASAFSSGTYVDVVGGCRTAVDWGLPIFDTSIIAQFSRKLDKKSEIHGSNVRVQYSGGVMTNAQLLAPNQGKEIVIYGRR